MEKFSIKNKRHKSLVEKLIHAGASKSFVVSISGAGLALLSHIIVARYLGVVEYGAYALVMSWVSVLAVPTLLGQDTSVVRFLPKYILHRQYGKAKGLRIGVTIIILCSSVVVSGCSALIVYLVRNNLSTALSDALFAGCILLPVLTQLQLNGALHRSLKRAASSGVFSSVARPVFLFLLVIILYFSTDRYRSAATVILANVMATLASLVLSERFLGKAWPGSGVRFKDMSYEVKPWLKMGGLLLLTSTMVIAVNRLDVLVVGGLLGERSVGPYYAALQLATLPMYWINAVFVIMGPVIVEYYEAEKVEELRMVLKNLAWSTFIVTTLICIIVAVSGYWVLGLFGGGFAKAYVPLLVMLTGSLVSGSIALPGYFLSMTRLVKRAPIIFGCGAALNLIVCLLLIPRFGVIGAAIASAVTPVSWRLIAFLTVKRSLNINPTIFTISKPIQ